MHRLKKVILKIKDSFRHLKEVITNINKEDVINNIKDKKNIIGFVIVIFMLIIVIMEFSITSKNQLLEDVDFALKDNKVSKISRHIEFQGQSISRKELEPLMKYYKSNSSRINETMKQLRNEEENKFFTIEKSKKLFRDNYYIVLNPVSIKVKANIKGSKIYLDDELIDSDLEKGVVPGIHKVKAILETPYGTVEKEQEVVLIKNEEVTLILDALNITISSNVKDADVYINGKSIGKKVEEVRDFGPIPMNSNVSISLEKKFPWGIIKSQEVKVTDIPNINVNINMVNDTLINNIKDISQEFYKSVFNALNSRNFELILFADKNTKEKIYSEIEKKERFLKNNYEINELSTEIESSEFRIEDNVYKGKVVIKVKYNVYKKLLPFLKESHEELFLTSMKYIGNEWLVEDVQRFNL